MSNTERITQTLYTKEDFGGMKKSVRAKFQNKMHQITNITNLTKKKIEKQEIALAKYGPGKVFGAIPYVINELYDYQPCTITCDTNHGQVLAISGHEFEKYVLTSKKTI